ncbi:DUF485 domain-containing protein [Streptomyces olivochromogenes]|uniref:DUF485 domain-containing protein n=1 Tax=Streptomyces olivochromogenes TaxID=1963 RepID=UPI001F279110|nr:DUF485 domain-containing protein [Streptomyces olivochromogenes]MCF3131064.1 DUF485 domain-containing protein [Streptomyces olivochromogenes]
MTSNERFPARGHQEAPDAAAEANPGQTPLNATPGALYDLGEFTDLRHRHRRLVGTMTAAFLSFYLGYVLLCTFAPDVIAFKVAGNVNFALVLGLAQFGSTFLIAWLYNRAADRRMSPLARLLADRCGAIEPDPALPARPRST